MKFPILALLVVACSLGVHAQTYNRPEPQPQIEIFKYVEQMPAFNGDVQEYLSKNLHYPPKAKEYGLQGRVYIEFVVMADGSVKDAKVIKSTSSPELDNEALRVVKAMPKWKPGKQNGRAVNCYYSLPITFRLE